MEQSERAVHDNYDLLISNHRLSELLDMEREYAILKRRFAILEQEYLVAKRVRESLEARLARASKMEDIGVTIRDIHETMPPKPEDAR